MSGTWLRVTIGGSSDYHTLSGRCIQQHIKLPPDVEDVLQGINFSNTQEQTLELEIVTPRALGFTQEVQQALFYNMAIRSGLFPVPTEGAFVARLEYTTQPENEIIYVGMDPVTLENGTMVILYLIHLTDGLGLRTTRMQYDSLLKPDVCFAFSRH